MADHLDNFELRRVLEAQDTPDGVARVVVDRVASMPFCSGGAGVVFWDAAAEVFRPGATSVPGQDPAQAARQVRTMGGASRWIVDHNEPLTVADLAEDPFGPNAMLAEAGNRAYLGVPLVAASTGASGVLFAMRREPGPFPPSVVDEMRAVGLMAGDICARLIEAAAPDARRRTIRIIVVDDDPALRESMGFSLRSLPDVDVETAGTSRDAEALAADPPDLMFIDIGLVGDTGPELYERLRAMWTDRVPRVWFMTGLRDRADAERDRALGVEGTLLKPFGREDLRRIIDEVRAGRDDEA